MQQATGPSATSGAFEPLRPLRPRQTVRPGCLSALAGPALALGLWLIGIAILVRPQDGSPRSVVIAGGVLAATGLFVLLVRMRRTIHAVVPVPELAIGQGECLTPGALVPLRVRLRGPARLARLKVTLVCERRYSEQTMTPGMTSLSAVDRVDVYSTQDVLDEADITVAPRGGMERVPTLGVPYLGRRSGPALPSGVVAWYLDVLVEPAVGKPIHDLYDLVVVFSDAPQVAPQPLAEQAAPQPPAEPAAASLTRLPSPMMENLGQTLGCAAVALGFLLFGLVFLWLSLSDTVATEGNPIVGFIGGLLFTALGVLGLYGLLSGRMKSRAGKYDVRDPRRLP